MIEIGLKYTSELTVTDAVTAIVVGSGDMPVLATPMMMALMENAAMLAVKNELPDGCTTVGSCFSTGSVVLRNTFRILTVPHASFPLTDQVLVNPR